MTEPADYTGILVGVDGPNLLILPSTHLDREIIKVLGGERYRARWTDGMALFTDPDSEARGAPFNLFQTVIAHHLGLHEVVFGNGVILGTNDNIISNLRRDVAEWIYDTLNHPDAAVIDRITAALPEHPRAIADMEQRHLPPSSAFGRHSPKDGPREPGITP